MAGTWPQPHHAYHASTSDSFSSGPRLVMTALLRVFLTDRVSYTPLWVGTLCLKLGWSSLCCPSPTPLLAPVSHHTKDRGHCGLCAHSMLLCQMLASHTFTP